MKKIIAISAVYFIFCSTFSFGQYQNSEQFHHKLSQALIDSAKFILRAKSSHYTKDSVMVDDFKKMYIGNGVVRKCALTAESIGVISVDFLQILDSSYDGVDTIVNRKTKKLNFTLIDSKENLGQTTKILKIPFNAWTWGVGTTPIRYRFKTNNSESTVSTSLNIGVSYGYTFGKSVITNTGIYRKAITIAPFCGIVTADLNKDAVTNPKTWEAEQTATRTNIGFSYGLSTIFGRNNLGLVISLGFDHLVGDKSDLWIYQDQPWIGIGINGYLAMGR